VLELRYIYAFAIAQVGANFAPKIIRGLTAGSYWFVKAKAPTVPQVFERADFNFLDGLNTAHKSLSKKDLIAAYLNASCHRRVEDEARHSSAVELFCADVTAEIF
jgi:hypothetical protein